MEILDLFRKKDLDKKEHVFSIHSAPTLNTPEIEIPTNKLIEDFKKNRITIFNKNKQKYISENFYLAENFKGKIMLDMKAFPNTIGERHPINFELMEKWYSDDAFCTGIVDKYVDFTLAGGFYIKTEEKNEKKIIVDWMRRNKFDNNLRDWLRKYFITGNGYLEMSGPKNKPPTSIKILDSRYMYVRRDNTGNILGYTQYMGGFNAPIFFDPHEIAHMKYKTIKDYAYGIGVIFPLTYTLIKKSEMIKDVCVIIKRKANSPIVGTVGTPESPASDEAVAQVAKNMEVLHSKTEISVSHLIKFGLIDFGNIGDKFIEPLKILNNELITGAQVPEVLLGRGNIPEGIADTQLRAFDRRIESIQQDAEKVIEENIIKRILIGHGLNPDTIIDFEWGKPNDNQKWEEIKRFEELLRNPFLSIPLKIELEKKLAELLGIKNLRQTPEEEREAEQNRKQPIVPGSNSNEFYESNENIDRVLKDMVKDYSIESWLGFNYRNYQENIQNYIYSPEYDEVLNELLLAKNPEQVKLGMLSNIQKEKFKRVLGQGLSDNLTMNDIAKLIKNDVKLKPLKTNGRNIPVDIRAINMARTEVVRISNSGVLKQLQTEGFNRYQWVAALSERTDEQCENLNGKIFEINTGPMPPVHNMCRCTIIGVLK